MSETPAQPTPIAGGSYVQSGDTLTCVERTDDPDCECHYTVEEKAARDAAKKDTPDWANPDTKEA